MNLNNYLLQLTQNSKKVIRSLYPRAIVSHELKLIYFPIPKVASTTIKTIFYENLSRKTELTKYGVHDFNFETLSSSSLNKLNDYIKFTIVRDPFERILSCYKDKITRHSDENKIFPGFNRYNILFGRRMFRKDMSFTEFLNTIQRIPDIISDEHFRSQTKFLPLNKEGVNLDYILKFENLKQEINNIPCLTQYFSNKDYHYNSTKKENYNSYIKVEEETLNKVYKRYKKDYMLLPYTIK